MSIQQRKRLIEPSNKLLSIEKQCGLLSLARSTFYYEPCPESPENLVLMRIMDQLYLEDPTKGARLLHQDLLEKNYRVNLKRVRRLMKKMGLEAIYPKPHLSKGNSEHQKFPYLLSNEQIETCNQVWASDITYVPIKSKILSICLPLLVIDDVRGYKIVDELFRKKRFGQILDIIYRIFEVKLGFVYGFEVNKAKVGNMEFVSPLCL